MPKSGITIGKTGGVFLLLSGMSLLLQTAAIAADAACAKPDASAKAGPTCADCDKIFSSAGSKLSDELKRLTAECCKPSCCDPCAVTPKCDDSACDGCADGCDACCEESWCCLGDPWKLFGTTCTGVEIGGWMQMGYHSENNGLFNNVPNKLNLQQGWFYMEKKAQGGDCLDWGFRVDAMYGTDGTKTQAFGNPPGAAAGAGSWDFQNGLDHGIYSFAVPQLYAEVAQGDFSVILGHFFTLVGYEVVTAPDNFFYSHSYTMFNSEPFTHTGILSTYTVSDDIEVYGGWTLGWDTGFDRLNDGNNYIGGVAYTLTDNVKMTYITTVGDFGLRGSGYSHSFVADIGLTDKLNYVFWTDLVDTNNSGATTRLTAPNNGSFLVNSQHSVNQNLFYTINDCLAVGTRFEWWKNDGRSTYAWTIGANIRPHANLVIRPEVRHDWLVPVAGVPTGPGPNTREFTTVAIDAILTF